MSTQRSTKRFVTKADQQILMVTFLIAYITRTGDRCESFNQAKGILLSLIHFCDEALNSYNWFMILVDFTVNEVVKLADGCKK